MLYRRLPIIALVVAVLVTGTAARTGAENLGRRDRMLRLLNQTRRIHDLPVFRLNRQLSTSAWRHSKRMAEANRVYHTDNLYRLLRSYLPSTWGENVGMAGRMWRVRQLWMQSSGHRANILKRAFRRVGVGVVKARGSVWVTVYFYGG
ncbi:MAG TPA: CAP domain-containing protein [Actinomycetota bacterium]|nr:CAP domain-containing protein [Actinomycetota bacterium]